MQRLEFGGYKLIAGAHRLKAAKALGWTSIAATTLDDIDADQAKLAEIDENLIRAALSPAEEAAHLAARKAVYLKLHPETGHGGDRKSVLKLRTRSRPLPTTLPPRSVKALRPLLERQPAANRLRMLARSPAHR